MSAQDPDHEGRTSEAKEPPIPTFFQPPCTCTECGQQFISIGRQAHDSFKYSKSLSRDEATEVAAKHMSKINADLLHLKNQCSKSGDFIITQWKKKSRAEREKILLTADPDLYPNQWLVSNLAEFGSRDNPEQRHKSYLFPYVTLPGLRDDPSKFLNLLLNRTQHTPEQWAAFDNSRLGDGWRSGAFKVVHFDGSIIMHGPRFGEVNSWDHSSAEMWEAVGFPRAILVLEAQEQMMRFLRSVVDQLLVGISGTQNPQTDSSKWHELSMSVFKPTNSVVYSARYLNQELFSPPLLDINEIICTVQSHLDEMEDHLRLLQTDSDYMRREMRLIGQSCTKEYSAAWKQFGGNHYSFIAKTFIQYVTDYLEWTGIRDECQHVKNIMAASARNNTSKSRLSPAVNRALGALELLVSRRLNSQSEALRARYMEEPSFSSHWSAVSTGYMEADDGRYARVGYQLKKPDGMEEMAKDDILCWAVTQLFVTATEDPNHLDKAGLYSIIDDYLTKCSAAERGRISPRMYEAIADTAALHGILSSLCLNRPLSTHLAWNECFGTEDRSSWRFLTGFLQIRQDSAYLQQRGSMVKQISSALEAFVAIPLPKGGRPDQSTVDSFEGRHKVLGEIWARVHNYWEIQHKKAKIPEADMKANLEVLQAADEPEHVEALRAEKAKIMAKISARSIAQKVTDTPQNQWVHQEVKTVTASPRTKKKTRGVSTQPELLPQMQNLQVIDEPDVPKVNVREQAFNILTAMFNSETKKQYDWVTFVTAMNEAGFPATHTGGGSAVSFNAIQSSPWKGRRINFHKPHPDSKIDPIILRAMGKRMHRRFGWSEGTFEVITKKA